MSKPTMQVEELRSFARKMDELMPRRADLVREAADTIMRLRDDLQTQREAAWQNTNRNAREYKRVCEENEKLREQVMQLKIDWEGERDYADQMEAKEIQAVAENAKLRQQLADVTESMSRVEERCAELRGLAENLKACNSSCGRCIELYGKCDYETELRELRVEVNV